MGVVASVHGRRLPLLLYHSRRGVPGGAGGWIDAESAAVPTIESAVGQFHRLAHKSLEHRLFSGTDAAILFGEVGVWA
jgi:hypothetical protein